MKIIKWLKYKINEYLGVNKLHIEIKDLHKELEESNINHQKSIRILFDKLNRLEKNNNEIKELNNYLVKQFNVSADLGNPKYHHNWAVLSIKGRQDYVRFVDLSQRDIREIQMFLKRFEGTNRIIDSPFRFF